MGHQSPVRGPNRLEKEREERDERAVMRTHMDQSDPGQDQMASNGTRDWSVGSLVRLAQNLPGLVLAAF